MDVINRWRLIKDAAAEKGITILGASGDGDSRILRAMEINSMLGQTVNSEIGGFFAMPLNNQSNMLYIQDTVHIGGKLRNKLLNEKTTLKIGNFEICKDHLVELTRAVNKDVHFITDSDLDGSDKMNFDSVEKISTENVQNLLKDFVPNSQGTQLYLKCIRYILDSFLKKDLQPLERLRKIWFSVFIFRIWRSWILKTPNYTLGKHFITRNSYIGVELNAHALTLLMFNEKTVTNTNFLPHLLSSQPCEQFFRTLRSMTSTYSTVINFSMLDILYRIGRVNLQEDLNSELTSEGIKLPRFQKDSHLVTPTSFTMPSKEDIKTTITAAEHEALLVAFEFGLPAFEHLATTFKCNIASAFLQPQCQIDLECTDEVIQSSEDGEDDFEKYNTLLPTTSDELYEEPEELSEDLRKLESVDTLNLKTLGNLNDDETVDESSQFVAVKIGEKRPVVIRKSSLVWLLRKDNKRISTDRLYRFRQS